MKHSSTFSEIYVCCLLTLCVHLRVQLLTLGMSADVIGKSWNTAKSSESSQAQLPATCSSLEPAVETKCVLQDWALGGGTERF